MTDSVEKRRAVLINTAYFILIAGMFYLFMRFAFWPLFPFIFAFFLAVIFQKPVNFITKKVPIKRGLVSLLVVTVTAVAAIGLLVLAGSRIIIELKELLSSVAATFESIPGFITKLEEWLLSAVQKLPQAVCEPLSASITDLAQKLLAAFEAGPPTQLGRENLNIDWGVLITPLSGVISTASKVPTAFVAVIICFIATCFITNDYDRIANFIKQQFPSKKRAALSRTKNLTISTLSKMVKAYFLIICITCTELIIGLTALKVLGIYKGGYIFTIAIIIAIVDIFPVLGSGTVLIPWGIISLLMGNYALGIGILVIYVIISVLRQFIEPKLVAGQLGLPPIVTLMGMYLGLKLFGVFGLFLLPFTINILKVLNDDGIIHLWRSSKEQHTPVELKKTLFKKRNKERKESNEQNH